jgi:DNA-binding beta-propeller fold protein YncE
VVNILAVLLLSSLASCGEPIVAFGRPGLGDGEFREPRTVSVSAKGVAVVDRSGRLQLFDADGRFLSKFAVAGDNVRRGLPCGVTWLADGTLAVADTHQGYVHIYDVAGKTVGHMGGFGAEPGQFNMPQRVAELPDGSLAVSDYGISLCNRVQVLTRDGKPLLMFGGPEPELGGLQRPMGLVVRDDGSFVLADQKAGLVVFAKDGRFEGSFGGHGPEAGDLLYGLCRAPDGTFYATDIGHHRLLRVAADGTVTGRFGKSGTALGEFLEPWDVAWSAGRLYVADKFNHRVQRIDVDRVKWEAP